MKAPADMTRAQLQAAAARADRALSAACDALIDAGRGRELSSETRAKSDPLALAWLAAADRCAELEHERRRRIDWHGTEHKTGARHA